MLSLKTLLGAGWSVSARTAGRIIDVITLLILARVLSPADFGLTAIAVSIIAIVDMVLEVPLVQALTRLREVGKTHLDTAFTIGLMRGSAIGVLMTSAAWPVALVYQDPRLFWLILGLSLGPISRSLYSPAMVFCFRSLDFRTAFIADFIGKVLASTLSIGVLLMDGGYWAIVVSAVGSSLIPTLLSYILAPYRPAASLARLSDFTAFTGWFTASQILGAVNWQYDRVLLGFHLDKASLGRYTVAGDFAVLPTQSIIGPAMRPVLAAFSTIVGNTDRLRSAYLKAARLTMLTAVPAGLGIALTSDLIVAIVLGPQWMEAAHYLTWLALAVIPTAYCQPFASLTLAIDRPSLVFWSNLLDFLARIILVTTAFYGFGIEGILYARVVVALLQALISAFYVRRLVGLTLHVQIRNLWQVALSCLLMSLCVLLLRQVLPQINIGMIGALAAIAVSGGLIYVGCMFACGFRLRALI